MFDVTADGQRFSVSILLDEAHVTRGYVIVVRDWSAQLEQ